MVTLTDKHSSNYYTSHREANGNPIGDNELPNYLGDFMTAQDDNFGGRLTGFRVDVDGEKKIIYWNSENSQHYYVDNEGQQVIVDLPVNASDPLTHICTGQMPKTETIEVGYVTDNEITEGEYAGITVWEDNDGTYIINSFGHKIYGNLNDDGAWDIERIKVGETSTNQAVFKDEKGQYILKNDGSKEYGLLVGDNWNPLDTFACG